MRAKRYCAHALETLFPTCGQNMISVLSFLMSLLVLRRDSLSLALARRVGARSAGRQPMAPNVARARKAARRGTGGSSRGRDGRLLRESLRTPSLLCDALLWRRARPPCAAAAVPSRAINNRFLFL